MLEVGGCGNWRSWAFELARVTSSMKFRNNKLLLFQKKFVDSSQYTILNCFGFETIKTRSEGFHLSLGKSSSLHGDIAFSSYFRRAELFRSRRNTDTKVHYKNENPCNNFVVFTGCQEVVIGLMKCSQR